MQVFPASRKKSDFTVLDMRIAFIQARGNDRREYEEALGFTYIKAYLRRIDPEIDMRVFSDHKELISFRPDLIGIGSVTSTFESARFLAAHFKQHLDVPIILGGYHITFLPEELITAPFDIGVLGEGEVTFCRLVELLRQTGEFDPSQLRTVPGLVFHDGSQVFQTEPRSPIEDINQLPFPEHTRNRMNPEEGTIFSSRGCPYCCKYCTSRTFWKRVRFFSPERVVEEIRYLVEKLRVSRITFLDDLFIFPWPRFQKIADLVEKAGLQKLVSFHGFVRANLVNSDVIRLMKKMNFDSIRFGAESGSDEILRRYKPETSVALNDKVIRLAKQYDMPVGAAFMVGFIGETEQDLEATAAFVRRHTGSLRGGGFYLFQPLPGSESWEELDPDMRRQMGRSIPWSRLQVGFWNPDFDADTVLYFNERSIPRERFFQRVKELFPSSWLEKLN